MTWILLRWGWGNSAAIFALALLPIVVVAGLALDQLRVDGTKASVVVAEQNMSAPAPVED
jgi:hypothetical protein